MTNQSYWRWFRYGGWHDDPEPKTVMYRQHKSPADYQPGDALNDYQQRAIRGIVDCDRFWTIPTNVFSFFYGLPDERDELRSLLTSDGSG